jgi:multiple sugar transport system substrate-binding protein
VSLKETVGRVNSIAVTIRPRLGAQGCRLVVALLVAGGVALQGGAAAAVELEVATWHWTEPARGAVLRKLAEEYVHEHPGVTIKEVSVPYPRYVEQMLLQLAGGAAPDVLVATDSMLFTFLERGHLASLESFPGLAGTLQRDREDFVDGQAIATISGHTYGLLSHYSVYALLYNEKLFAEAGISKPPATPQEFLAVAKRLTKAPEQFGYATRHAMNEEAGWWYELAYWVHGFGGHWTTSGKPSVHTPQVIDGVRFFKQLYDASVFPKGVDAATYRRMFWQEKIAMLTDNNAVYFIAKSQNPNLQLRAAPNPFSPPVTVGEVSFYTIPKGAKHPQEAATFIEWHRRHLRELGMSLQNPVGSKAANAEILKTYPFLRTFVDEPLAENGGALPKGYEGRMPEFRHIVLQHVTNVLVNNADPAAEMRAAQSELGAMRR